VEPRSASLTDQSSFLAMALIIKRIIFLAIKQMAIQPNFDVLKHLPRGQAT
jgi:hypothetical protein